MSRALDTTNAKSTEDRVLEFLKRLDFEEARFAESWVESFGSIAMRYAEYTGGHCSLTDLFETLSTECFK